MENKSAKLLALAFILTCVVAIGSSDDDKGFILPDECNGCYPPDRIPVHAHQGRAKEIANVWRYLKEKRKRDLQRPLNS